MARKHYIDTFELCVIGVSLKALIDNPNGYEHTEHAKSLFLRIADVAKGHGRHRLVPTPIESLLDVRIVHDALVRYGSALILSGEHSKGKVALDCSRTYADMLAANA